eukprot:SAG31_NODE_30751_length_376_cov_1.249097_1_plen_118_part_01
MEVSPPLKDTKTATLRMRTASGTGAAAAGHASDDPPADAIPAAAEPAKASRLEELLLLRKFAGGEEGAPPAPTAAELDEVGGEVLDLLKATGYNKYEDEDENVPWRSLSGTDLKDYAV